MAIGRKLITLFLALTSFSALKAQEDTTLHYQKDSAVETEQDCTERFFQEGEKTTNPGKIQLITKTGKIVNLANFLKKLEMDSGAISSPVNYTFTDLDNDGKKELVISNYTGGAHCCDELYFYKNIAPNTYQYTAKTFAGDVCITNKNEFVYDFYQQFGYFFTCFACAYADSSDAAPVPVHTIIMKYNKGKLSVVPGDKELSSTVNDNLGKLGEQPYERLEDASAQDNGLRKEMAMNLTVYYYSFGRSLPETQKLFNKFYKFPDAKKVWIAFVNQLGFIRKNNDF